MRTATFSNNTLLRFANEPLIEEFQRPASNPMDEEFKDKVKNLSDEIEALKAKQPSLNYIDCTVEICMRHDVDFDSLKKALSKTIKEKIEMDAAELNLLTYKPTTLL